jgi:hypothetical protein
MKGFMVGNGCTDYDFDVFPAGVETFYQHGLISRETFYSIMNDCTPDVWYDDTKE